MCLLTSESRNLVPFLQCVCQQLKVEIGTFFTHHTLKWNFYCLWKADTCRVTAPGHAIMARSHVCFESFAVSLLQKFLAENGLNLFKE